MSDTAQTVLVWLGIIALFVGLTMLSEAVSCHNRWGRSGLVVSWGPSQGCLVSREGKTFVPDKNYREVDAHAG